MAFIEDLLITFLYSKRAQWAVLLGIFSFMGISLLGHHMVANLHLGGALVLITEIISQSIALRYEHVAWGALISFWVLAGKLLLKDMENITKGK